MTENRNSARYIISSLISSWLSKFSYNQFQTYWDSACDLWTFGMVMITQLLLVNTCHLALLVKYWTWPMFWSMVLSVGGFFLAALLYNGFVSPSWTWTGAKDPPVMIAQQSLTDLRFWLVSFSSNHQKYISHTKSSQSRALIYKRQKTLPF